MVVLFFCPKFQPRPIILPDDFEGWRLDTLNLCFFWVLTACVAGGVVVMESWNCWGVRTCTLVSPWQAASGMKCFGIHFGSTLCFDTVADTVFIPSMLCVSFSDPFLFLFWSCHGPRYCVLRLLCSRQIRFFSSFIKRARTSPTHIPWRHTCKSQSTFGKSQLTSTKVSRTKAPV